MFIALNLLLSTSLLFTFPVENIKSEVTFCNLEIPQTLKKSNSSFSIAYSFEIDETGKPSHIVKIIDNFVGQEKVMTCLKEWHFHGLSKGTKLVAFFRWQHGKGWVEIQITGRKSGFSQIIRVRDGVGY